MSARQHRPQKLRLGALTLLGLLAAAEAPASESVRERIALRPSLRATIAADDNALHTRKHREDQLGVWIEPRLEIDVRRPSLEAELDLSLDARLQSGAREAREVVYDLRGSLAWEPLRGLELRVGDAFSPRSLKLGAPSDELGNLSQTNLAWAELRFARESRRRLGFSLGVRAFDFQTDVFDVFLDLDGDGLAEEASVRGNHRGLEANVETRFALGRRTALFARSEMRWLRFDEIRSDHDELAALLGVRWRAGRNLHAELAFGWGRVDFRELPDDDRLLGRAELEYRLPRGWSMKALFEQRFTSGAANTDFDETTLRTEIGRELGTRTRVWAGGLVTRFRRDAPDSARNRVWALELGVRRQLARRLQGRVAYRHWHNDGELGADDFQQNRVTLELLQRF